MKRMLGAGAALALLSTGCHFTPPSGVDVLVVGGSHVPAKSLPVLDLPQTGSAAPASSAPVGASVRALAEHHAAARGLPRGLVLGVVEQESGFNTRAVSPVGAQGLMQLMPDTVKHINAAGDVTVLDAFDADQNLAGGCWYLGWVKRQVPASKVEPGEEWKFALGAYNGGIGRVSRAIDQALAGAPRSPRVKWADIAEAMPAETRRYVPAVLSRWDKFD